MNTSITNKLIHVIKDISRRQSLLTLLMFTFFKASAFIPAPSLSSPSNNSNVNGFNAYLSTQSQQGVSVFHFQIDTANTFSTSKLKNFYASGTNYTSSKTLRKGRTYYWRARAINGTDTSAWSSSYNFSVSSKMMIHSPADLSTEPVRQLQCSNYSFDEPIEYLFEMDTANTMNSSNHQFKKTSLNSVLDTPYFKFGRRIYWRVTAINIYGDSMEWTKITTYNILNNPAIVYVSTPSDAKVVLSLLNMGAASPFIEVDTTINFDSPGLYQKLLIPGKTSDTIENLFFGQKYYYRVQSHFGGRKSNWSTMVNFTVKNPIKNVDPFYNETVGSLLVNFSWDRIKGSRTHVQISSDPSFNNLMLDSIFTDISGSYKLKDTLKLNTRYYWRLRAMHALDTMPWQNLSFTTFKGEIYQKTPINNANNQNINVKFTAYKENWAHGYFIEIDTGKVFGTTPSSFNIKSRNVKIVSNQLEFDTLLRYGTQYVWRIFAILKNDTSQNTYSSTFKTIVKPKLDFPYNTSIGTGTTLEGLINSIPGSTHVLWEMDTSKFFNSSKLTSGKDTHLIDNFYPNKVILNFSKELDFETKYYWRARCMNSIDTSDWSDLFYFVSTQRPWINSPADKSIIKPSGVVLNWGVQGSVNDYTFQYQFSTDSNFVGIPIKSITKGNSSQANVSCAFGQTYFWRGRAYHGKDTSSWSITSRFTTESAPVISKIFLISPANLTKNLKGTSTPLKWLIDTNVVSYDIQVSSDTNCINILTSGNTVDEIINFTGMDPGTTYFWRVRGKVNNQFVGPWSDVWRFSTEPNLTSINNIAPLSSVQIYPNPANEVLNIDCPTEGDIKIYSNKGELVYSSEFQSGKLEINTSDFASGLYTLMIKTTTQYQSYKIVIQH